MKRKSLFVSNIQTFIPFYRCSYYSYRDMNRKNCAKTTIFGSLRP